MRKIGGNELSAGKMLLAVLFLGVGFSVFGQNYSFFGNFDKPSPVYQAGEKMEFTVSLLDGDKPVVGKKLKWVRTGDDGITVNGEGVSTAEGLKITASTDKPGFVRVYVTALGDDGKALANKVGDKVTPVFFDGGACVAPETLVGVPEPADFDVFWQKQRELLATVPLKVLEMKEVAGNAKVKAYDIKIACAGKMPVSGYLVMPKDAKPKSLAAEVSFNGYGVSGASKNLQAGEKEIYLNINAHGFENGQPKEYYDNLAKTTLKGYAFDLKENSNPDTCYFNGMFLRVMRALEFVKSLPEWNGKDLKASGGSQGGLQSLAAAGLDKDVIACTAWSPWCCDLGGVNLGRLRGWRPDWTAALNYYDPINLVKRANPACQLEIIANLGDYVCPPSGVWVAYNNFPGPKKIEVRQGCEHGFTMKNYPKFTFTAGTNAAANPPK